MMFVLGFMCGQSWHIGLLQGVVPLLIGRVSVLLTRWARRLGAVCRLQWFFFLKICFRVSPSRRMGFSSLIMRCRGLSVWLYVTTRGSCLGCHVTCTEVARSGVCISLSCFDRPQSWGYNSNPRMIGEVGLSNCLCPMGQSKSGCSVGLGYILTIDLVVWGGWKLEAWK